jgi:hypothetical protein
MRGARNRGVGETRQLQIVGVAALAPDETEILAAANGISEHRSLSLGFAVIGGAALRAQAAQVRSHAPMI